MGKRVGSAAQPFIVGQDPKRRAAIEASLYEDFKPKDVLEEIWLSDIAVLTTTIEYYRELEAAVTLTIANRHQLGERLKLELAGKQGLSLNDAPGTDAFRKSLGDFTKTDVERIGAIADLITKMRRERERVYLLFERKRRPLLLNAVKTAEMANKESYVIENLSD